MTFCVFLNCAASMQSSVGWWATVCFLAATVATAAAQQRELTPVRTELQFYMSFTSVSVVD